MLRRTPLVVSLCVIGASALAGSQQDLTRREADSMDRKLATIVQRGNGTPTRSAKPLRTSFTEREVNAYLKYHGQEQMPPGVLDPRLFIEEGGRVEVRAVVDLTAVRQAKERAWTDPMTYLGGAVEVRASGIVRGSNGMGMLQLQSATLGGVPIPVSLLQDLVSYYTRTPESPQGFDLTKPFELPANIRHVEIQRGAATVVQ